MPLRRLPHTAEARAKMRAAALGRRHSPEARAKIAAARAGRKHSPETIEKIRAKATGRRKETLEEGRRRNHRQLMADMRALIRQRRLDIRVAHGLGDMELVQDIVQSRGLWSKRRRHHPLVSDGWRRLRPGTGPGAHGSVWGFPKNLDERVRIGLIKGYIRTNAKRSRKNGLATQSG